MAKLEEFVQPAQERTREQFARDFPHFFLLLRLEQDDTEGDWSFKTATIASGKLSLAKLLHRENLMLSAESNRLRVFAVVKRAENPWHERVSVGRARNNDIVLPHKSVSKIHAHFVTKPGGALELQDAGSRNGTRWNDKSLGSDEVVTATSGDTVTFGAVNVTCIDSAALYDLVKRNLRPRAREG